MMQVRIAVVALLALAALSLPACAPCPNASTDSDAGCVPCQQPDDAAVEQQPAAEVTAPARVSTAEAAPPQREYTVAGGDSLWLIAQRMYGDGTRHTAIAEANPGVDPTGLQVGQRLVIPALPGADR